MAEIDEHMHEMAEKALKRNSSDWQAYLLLDVSERRMAEKLDKPEERTTETRTDGDTALESAARLYASTGDMSALSECISAAQATISELHAASSGDCRKRIEEWARSLSSML